MMVLNKGDLQPVHKIVVVAGLAHNYDIAVSRGHVIAISNANIKILQYLYEEKHCSTISLFFFNTSPQIAPLQFHHTGPLYDTASVSIFHIKNILCKRDWNLLRLTAKEPSFLTFFEISIFK